MVTEGDQVAQQLLTIDFCPAILDLYRTPVRLMGNQAVGFEQVTDQRLFHHFAAGTLFQPRGVKLIVVDLNVLIVDAGAVEVGDGLAFKLINPVERHRDLTLGTGA